MDDQNDERMERRDKTGQHSLQSEEKGSNRMLRDGLEILSFSPQKLVSWGVLSGLAGLIFGTVTVFQRFNSTIDQRILDNPTINKRLDRTDWEIDSIKQINKEQDKKITDIESYFNPKRK